MLRDTKDSPWNFYEPKSFRQWLRKSMMPMGYDKALKRKERLAMLYFFASIATLNVVVWGALKNKKEAPTVPTESPILDQYALQTPTDDEKEIYVFNFRNFKLESTEHIDQKELVKKRHEK